MDAYYRVVANFARLFAPEPAAGSRTCVKWVPDGLLIQLGASIDADSAADRESRFVRSVSSIIHECRVARRNPTVDERIATEVAYWLLKQGTRVPGPFPTWGVSGRRPIQTLVSITDPGEGHISGTTADPDHLRG
jgi:hypothetical protein